MVLSWKGSEEVVVMAGTRRPLGIWQTEGENELSAWEDIEAAKVMRMMMWRFILLFFLLTFDLGDFVW